MHLPFLNHPDSPARLRPVCSTHTQLNAVLPSVPHCRSLPCACAQVWGVGGKFGTSAAVGVVLPPAPQMVEKQGWSYVSRPTQLLRGAHEPQNDITSIAFSKVCICHMGNCCWGTEWS